MTLWTNNLNGISSGTTPTSGNSGGTSGTAFTVTLAPTGGSLTAATAAAFEGTNGLQIVFPATSTTGFVGWGVSAAVGTRVSGSFWYRFAAAPTTLDSIANLGAEATIRVTTGGQVALYDTNNAAVATATAVTGGTWVFIQWAVTASASANSGRYEFRVTRSDGTALVLYDSGATVSLGGTFGTLYHGRNTAAAVTQTSSYDLLAADNTLTSGFPGSPAPASPYAPGQFFPFL